MNGMKFLKFIMSRGLPKTGQEIQYRAGDDGQHELGWWMGRLVLNNKTRFIIQTLNGDDVVIDRATGLIWAREINEAGCNNGATATWDNAIDYCNNLSFAGFADWRLPNLNELFSIVDWSEYGGGYTCFYPDYFTGLVTPTTGLFWVSTTYAYAPILSFCLDNYHGNQSVNMKTQSHYLRAVRNND